MIISKRSVVLTVVIILLIVLYFRRSQFEYMDNIAQFKNKELTPDRLYKHLTYTSNLLQKHGIKHWLIYGTLLGAVRDDNIIPHDYDFDLGALVIDADRIFALNPVIKSDGYEFKKALSYIDKTEIWRVSFKVVYKGIDVGDIYLYQKFDDGFMRRFDVKRRVYFWPKSTFPTYFINHLDIATVRGQPFPAPRDPAKLLRHWYGKTWKKPIKAKAQGGKGDPDSDYYGGAKEMPLSNLIKSVPYKLTPKLNVRPKYVFPPVQKKWIEQNENIV